MNILQNPFRYIFFPVDRRSFLKSSVLGGAALTLSPQPGLKTKHLIFIVNGSGARKKDYYEDASISPNINKLARESFVFEEDHCDQVASHEPAWSELLQGFPQYIRNAYRDEATRYWSIRSFHLIPKIMSEFKPRVLILRQDAHDAGHRSFEDYLAVAKSTDQEVGRIVNWVKRDPYFSTNTAIVIRPEFGRDDEINRFGELHHSEGFYYTHRVASIFWGPDFRIGVDKTVVNRRDMGPTLTRLFNVETTFSKGQVLSNAFK